MFVKLSRLLATGCLAVLAATALATAALAAPPTAAERADVRRAEAAMAKAGNFFRAKKYQESGESAREALEIAAALPADDSRAWQRLLRPLAGQLDRARELLAEHGVTIRAWKPGQPLEPTDTVSFVREVAPILVKRCGGCHVTRARGEFSMASFAALAQGSPSGAVFLPGNATGSRMIELIESGDMPRGDGRVPAKELATLKSWIDSGAKFDGDDESASLASLTPDGMPQRAPRLMVVAAADDDEVQFARDVAPILRDNCLECHGENRGANGFSMFTFDRLIRGGGNGPPLVAGDSEASLIIKKLRGTALGARMPQGRDPLPEESIAKIARWIELGGKFDGFSSASPLADTIEQRAAGSMSHAELAQRRVERAEQTWRLVMPYSDFQKAESENVLVVGSVGPQVLAGVVATADEQIDKIRRLFHAKDDEPLIKGRMTLYVFDKRYDYAEVGTMLERREIPDTWRGHWMYNPLDPYGCVLLDEDKHAPPGVVAQQIAGVYLAGMPGVPRWFAEGSARAVAARVEPRDPRVRHWDQQASEVLTALTQPEQFLTGGLAPEDGDVLSYSFVSKFLMSPATRYGGIIGALQQGANFEEAFAKIYGGKPTELIPGWTNRVGKRRK